MVDLNKRVFADLPLETGSRGDLFDLVLDKLTDQTIWEEKGCETCEDQEWCPFYANVRMLRAPATAVKLKTLWAIQELKGDRHATMRDLLATLSYVIIGHQDMYRRQDDEGGELLHPCRFVEREKAIGEPLGLYRRLIYNSAFRDEDIYEGGSSLIDGGSPISDRTMGFAPAPWEGLATCDPSRRAWSQEWERLEIEFLRDPQSVLDALKRTSAHETLLETLVANRIEAALAVSRSALFESEPSDPAYRSALEDNRMVLLILLGISKRRAFFFSNELNLDSLTNYRYLTNFRTA